LMLFSFLRYCCLRHAICHFFRHVAALAAHAITLHAMLLLLLSDAYELLIRRYSPLAVYARERLCADG